MSALSQLVRPSAQQKSIGRRLARNTLWSVVGSGFSQGSALLTAFVVARLLGVAAFGQLALIQTTILLFGTLGEFGFVLTTTKYVSRWRTVDPARAGRLIGWSLRNVALSGIAVGVILATVGPLVGSSFGLAGMGAELRVGCILLVCEMLNRVQFGALAGLEAFSSSAQVYAVRGILSLPCAWFGAKSGGLLGAVVALAIVSAATLLAGNWVLRRSARSSGIAIRFGSRREAEVLSTSASLWISTLLLTGSTWIVTVLLSRHPGGLAQLGLFNAADKWKTALLFLPTMLFQVTLPMLSNSHAAGDYRGCWHTVVNSILSTLGVTGIGAAFLWAFSRPLMASYGVGFAMGAPVLSLAAAVAVICSIYTVGSSVLWALGRPSLMVKIDLLRTVILLASCWFGLAANAWSLTLAFLICYSAGCIALLIAMRRHLMGDRDGQTA